MHLLFRALLIWLLVLAVPAQAAAAVTMAFCGPGHHGGTAATRAQPGQAGEHVHHGSDVRQAHQHADTAMVDDDVSVSSNVVMPSKLILGDKHKCSACASCCSVAAIPTSMPSVSPPEFAVTVFSIIVPSVAAFAADGPDRPPRIVLV